MKNKLPSIVIILILSAIAAAFWLFFNIYRSFNQKPESKISEEISKPLTPSLDTKTIDIIEKKLIWEDSI